MTNWKRSVLLGILGMVLGSSLSYAQTTVDPDTGLVVPRDSVVGQPVPPDRVVVKERIKERIVERDRQGELYVAGFGGLTLGHSFSNVDGRGTLANQSFNSVDLANSVIYGMKVGYFHPGRLNWLGLEMEGFNTTPHLEQQNNVPGSHLRVTTLAFNLIARTRLACRPDDRSNRDRYDRTRPGTSYERDGREYYEEERTPADENARCPLQLYAGAGPGIFFAQTSNQFGRSTDNAEVGVNALAGVKYFVHRNVSIFGEYKLNYARGRFSQLQGTTAGLQGNYKASYFVLGLAAHF